MWLYCRGRVGMRGAILLRGVRCVGGHFKLWVIMYRGCGGSLYS